MWFGFVLEIIGLDLCITEISLCGFLVEVELNLCN